MSNFASGKFSEALCARCGFEFSYLDLVQETQGLWVCQSCNDGRWSIIEHPQNHTAPVAPDPQGLRRAFPDTVSIVSVAVSSWQDGLIGPNQGPNGST